MIHCQALYTFFGVAIFIGLVSGILLHLISRFGTNFLGLDRSELPKDIPAKGHTVASYRAERRRKKQLDKELANTAKARMQALDPLLRNGARYAPRGRVPVPLSPKTPKRRDGLLGTTILEEVDYSEEEQSAF